MWAFLCGVRSDVFHNDGVGYRVMCVPEFRVGVDYVFWFCVGEECACDGIVFECREVDVVDGGDVWY